MRMALVLDHISLQMKASMLPLLLLLLLGLSIASAADTTHAATGSDVLIWFVCVVFGVGVATSSSFSSPHLVWWSRYQVRLKATKLRPLLGR
jgi:hypothetical protein